MHARPPARVTPPMGCRTALPQEPDLGMRILLVHGDDVVADSSQAGLAQACETYKRWIHAHWPAH